MSSKSLLDLFSARTDPRQSWKVVYSRPKILLAVSCGAMAGAEDFVEIKRWADRKLDFFPRILPFKQGVRSHDTLNEVLNALLAALFSECFTAWVAGLRDGDADIVAIDGKTSRRARNDDEAPLHTASAWASRQRLVLGQEAVASKSNEIRRHKVLAMTFHG